MTLANLRKRIWHAIPTTQNEFEARVTGGRQTLAAPECPQCQETEALLSVVGLQQRSEDDGGGHWLVCRWRCRNCGHAPAVAFKIATCEYLLPNDAASPPRPPRGTT